MKQSTAQAMKNHPPMDTLLAYLEDAESDRFTGVRLHIASCNDCRATLQRLHNQQETIRNTGPYQNRLAGASPQLAQTLDQQHIERYVDGDLSATQSASVKQLLESDPGALKAALHYASHSASSGHLLAATLATQPGTEATAAESSVAPAPSKTSAFMEKLKKLFDFRPPVWISVPATATAVLLLTVVATPVWMASAPQGLTVASYQDKAVIHYQGGKQLPGIGFFNKAHRSTESFGAMEIQYNDQQTLSLRWPAVPNASSYHLAIYLISEGHKLTVQEMDLSANHTAIPAFKAETGKRYEWTLNGETTADKSFYTSGGFVISQRQ